MSDIIKMKVERVQKASLFEPTIKSNKFHYKYSEAIGIEGSVT